MMNDQKLLDSTCRVAIAALLHDIGKFAERAQISEAKEKDAEGIYRKDISVQLYCPEYNGHRTHIHAAYSAIALDILERHFPELVGDDMTPFAPWRNKSADDSLINATAKHHRPETYLQWVIATADRLASGFEREEFEKYNASTEETQVGKNHYTARMWTLFEQIRLDNSKREKLPVWRYALKPLSPEGVFPVAVGDCEKDDRSAAQNEYRMLWDQFVEEIKVIPHSHRSNLALWLDHFESLWICLTQAVPAATAFGVKPDVSLYDHSKTTAALAATLWRYHHDRGDDVEAIREELRAQWDKDRRDNRKASKAWSEEKFMLVQGDFTGIQNFIFAEGGSTQKHAAKLLRGRSFYVSLLTDLAALKVLEALDLPPTNQVVNAAGKFLIVVPNTEAAVEKLRTVQKELNDWFLEHTYGQSGLLLAWLPASAEHFKHGDGDTSPFRELMVRLFQQLEAAKLQRFGLCAKTPPKPVFEGFLDRFEHGECRIDGRSPGVVNIGVDTWVSALAADQIDTGKWLATQKRVLITRSPLNHHTLRLNLFGYHVNFTESEEDTGRFGNEARTGNLVRAWDFALPESSDAPLWNGYARRHINAHVPRFGEMNAWDAERYQGIEKAEDFEPDPREFKTLNHLARDDRRLENGRWVGIEALMTLKGDVDNLGLIFQKGLERPNFAKMAALSRQVNAFFTVYLPWLCQKEFPNTYTVFAGGDDFFLIGPWHSTIRLAGHMREAFACYVAGNPDIHFSAGLSMTKPGLPIRQLADLTEKALDDAKAFNPNNLLTAPKNAVTCFGQTVSWNVFDELMQREEALRKVAQDLALSTGYLYALLGYTDMAAEIVVRPEAALWHSHFAYRTRRLAETRFKDVEDKDKREQKRRALQMQLGTEIAGNGIEKHGAAYKIALFTYLYQQRD